MPKNNLQNILLDAENILLIVENILLVVENVLLVVGDMFLVKSEDILSLGIRSHSGQRIFSILSSHSPFCLGFENIMICP